MFGRSFNANCYATRASLILIAACLPACSRQSTPLEGIPSAPAKPRLSPEARELCPDPQSVTDGSPIGIASADAELARLYRQCQAKDAAKLEGFDALADAYDQLANGARRKDPK